MDSSRSGQLLAPVGHGPGRAGPAGADIYEVMSPGNEPHFRWSDTYRQTLRIHTKHVGQTGVTP